MGKQYQPQSEEEEEDSPQRHRGHRAEEKSLDGMTGSSRISIHPAHPVIPSNSPLSCCLLCALCVSVVNPLLTYAARGSDTGPPGGAATAGSRHTAASPAPHSTTVAAVPSPNSRSRNDGSPGSSNSPVPAPQTTSGHAARQPGKACPGRAARPRSHSPQTAGSAIAKWWLCDTGDISSITSTSDPSSTNWSAGPAPRRRRMTVTVAASIAPLSAQCINRVDAGAPAGRAHRSGFRQLWITTWNDELSVAVRWVSSRPRVWSPLPVVPGVITWSNSLRCSATAPPAPKNAAGRTNSSTA